MAWINMFDNPDQEYAGACFYHGFMNVAYKASFMTFHPIAKHVPLIVSWNGTKEDLEEQLDAFFEGYCEEHNLISTAQYPGGTGDYYASIYLERVEEGRTAIPDVVLKAFQEDGDGR